MSRRRYRDIVRDAMPGTNKDISERTGLALSTVYRWTRHLHASGEAHIAKWVRGHGPASAVYGAGAGKDKPGLKPLPDAVTSRRYRRKARADGSWEERNARQRAKYWARKRSEQRDPLLAAFYGDAR